MFEDVVPTDGEPLRKEAIQKMYDSAKNIIEKAKARRLIKFLNKKNPIHDLVNGVFLF